MKRLISGLLALTIFISSMAIAPVKVEAAPRAETVRKGIDVSKWQGVVDWNAVKASGVEFAMIKCGGRDENDGSLYEDPYYKSNIEKANAAGLNCGVYFYSQATSPEEAYEEARFVIARIYSYRISMPVYLDFEWKTPNARMITERLTKADYTQNILTFLNTIRNAGYDAGVYGNDFWINRYFDAAAISKNYRVWASNFKIAPNQYYTGTYDIWQYSDKGSVPGVSTKVDLNYWFDDGKGTSIDYSKVFDAKYYLKNNPDVPTYGGDPGAVLEHYLTTGVKQGRIAHPTFNLNKYAVKYPDLQKAFGSNMRLYLEHYIKIGLYEGRTSI